MPAVYTFTNNGKEEEIGLEKWAWGVLYKDGTELHQFGADKKFHRFGEIDIPNVKMFTMYQTDGSPQRFDLIIDNVSIFHFYRHITLDYGTDVQRKAQIYVFGWKDHTGRIASYNYILPNGRFISSTHDIQDLTPYGI